MLNVSSFNFGSTMPVVAIGKYSEFGFGDNYIGDTYITDRGMSFKRYSLLCQGFLKCQFNRGIAVWLWFLPKPSLATAFSTSIIKSTKFAEFLKVISFSLPSLIAIPRAELLASLIRASGWLTAYRAFIRCSFTEARQLLAPIGTEALRWLRTPTIKWVVFFTTIITESNYLHSHTYIIPQKQIEEKYCEIAAKRCSQGVMELRC